MISIGILLVLLNVNVDARWSSWESGPCSVSCGGGILNRTRTCDKDGGCYGAASVTMACSHQPCPINGGWSVWGAYQPCNHSCAGGRQRRLRTCTNPVPLHGGKKCLGEMSETRSCNNHECPVDGRYSAYHKLGKCTRTCGGGLQTMIRYCNNPAPAFGGRDCVGNDRYNNACNTSPCIDGFEKYPVWPDDFTWSKGKELDHHKCILPNTISTFWAPMYFCVKVGRGFVSTGIELTDTDKSSIWKRCVEVTDPLHPWNKLYMCMFSRVPYWFKLSTSGPEVGKKCMPWLIHGPRFNEINAYLCEQKCINAD